LFGTHEGNKSNAYEITFNDTENTKLEIAFDQSIRSIINVLNDHDANKLGLLKSLQYQDSGFKMRDTQLNLEYLSSSDNYAQIDVSTTEEFKRLNTNIKINKIVLNPEYNQGHPNPMYLLHARNGSISVGVDFSFEEKPSQLQYEMAKNPDFKKKGVKLVLDSYELKIKDMHFDTALFQSSISGTVTKEPSVVIPNANLDMQIKKYSDMFNYHISLYNINVDDLLTEHPFLPLNKIQPDKKNSFISFFKELGDVSGDDMKIKIHKETGGDVMIGKKNALQFLSDLQQMLEKPYAKN